MSNTRLTRNLSDSPLLQTGGSNLWITLLLYILVGIMVALLCLVSFVGVCEVNKSSMYPTLNGGDPDNGVSGDHVLTLKHPVSIKPGDIVILDAPDSVVEKEGKQVLFIKRVVAIGGDTLKFKLELPYSGAKPDGNTKVLLSRRPKGATAFELIEPFVKDDLYYMRYRGRLTYLTDFPFEDGECCIEIPENQFYVLGDNRNNSDDSRAYGAFARDKIQGKMFYKLEPGTFLNSFFRTLYKSSAQK